MTRLNEIGCGLGAVQRQSHSSYPIQTHVDMVVTGADGKSLQQSWSQDIFVSRRVPGKGPDWTRFEVALPGKLPAGSTIQAACHNGTHPAESQPGESWRLGRALPSDPLRL